MKIRTEAKQKVENSRKAVRLSRGFEKVCETGEPQAGLGGRPRSEGARRRPTGRLGDQGGREGPSRVAPRGHAGYPRRNGRVPGHTPPTRRSREEGEPERASHEQGDGATVTKHPKKRSPGPGGFTAGFYQSQN